MTANPAPYNVPFDLGGLSERGAEVSLQPDTALRARLAEWLEVSSVESLSATVRISRAGDDHYRYEARFMADVVQACVVTLEPVPSHQIGEFSRDFWVEGRLAAHKPLPAKTTELAALDDDQPDMLTGSILDVAAPVLEELSLALDPYPRAPGAAFDPPPEAKAPLESPFAALAKLKLNPAAKGAKPPKKTD